MGTDIHAFVEIDNGDRGPPFSETRTIVSVTRGSFQIGGGYEAFDALAWGRAAAMAPEDRDPSLIPLIAPRGMPNPRSVAVAWNYFYLVAPPSDMPNRWFWPQDRCVTPDVAEEWVRSKDCSKSTMIQWINVPRQRLKGGKLWFIREVRAPLVLKAIQRVGIGFREGRKAAG
jgi:hypothetical protein